VDSKLFDCSDYDMDAWDPACFKAYGITRAITNSFRIPNARRRIETLRAAGIEVAGVYGFCYFGPEPHYTDRDVDAAILLAKEYGIPMVWVDAEADANEIGGLEHLRASNPSERVAQLGTAINKVQRAGLPVGIYTAGWWWPSHMAGSTAFREFPLWHASYGANTGNFPPTRTVDYGGWRNVAIHQYTSQGNFCGRLGRDLNYQFEVPNQEEPLTPDERKEIDELFRRTGGRTERANNADLLAYADGLNSAILTAADAIAQGGGLGGDDIKAILKAIAAHLDPQETPTP